MQLYHQAAFCLEEVLMHQPVSVGTHLTLADVLCTLGGTANLVSARSHYSGTSRHDVWTEGGPRAACRVFTCAGQ